MKITAPFVAKVLRKISFGLWGGGIGDSYDGEMCVQHVIQQALGEGRGDRPSCVDDVVRMVGIALNDAKGWSGRQARAEGMKRFAVAQLGTRSQEYDFNAREFNQRLDQYLWRHSWRRAANTLETFNGWINSGWKEDSELTRIANDIADILTEMKTPGSEYLCMVDWPAEDLAKPLEEA